MSAAGYQLLAHEPVEVFSVLRLSVKHRVVGYASVSSGTLDGTVVHPRKVFRVALMASATSICLPGPLEARRAESGRAGGFYSRV